MDLLKRLQESKIEEKAEGTLKNVKAYINIMSRIDNNLYKADEETSNLMEFEGELPYNSDFQELKNEAINVIRDIRQAVGDLKEVIGDMEKWLLRKTSKRSNKE